MALTPGTRLGPYEVVAQIGAGGMGVVYRARDTRLERTVAIKVLPEALASDAERLARFEREAKSISSLNHPHICTLYDVGRQDGIDFLVMEYLEGETLAERLMKGALPLDRALRHAIEIADALDKAHRQGIVHRDLKPGNIMLTTSGATLLDFGLAKLRPVGTAGAVEVSAAPTVSSPLTGAGSIVGTFQYMAPELLDGQDADARTDIFAFGAVLYEMLTGRKAFEGRSQASLIAAIIHVEPAPLSMVQPVTPPALERLVATCLAKDPEDRWQTARDLVRELRWIVGVGSRASGPAPMAARGVTKERIAWAAGLAFVALVAVVLGVLVFRPGPVAPEMRLDITTPPTRNPTSIALSPDGLRIVFEALTDGRSQLWMRRLDADSSQPLNATEGASLPFWSPDSRSVGFFADGRLKVLDVETGATRDLAGTSFSTGGTWNRDGLILFVPGAGRPVMRIPVSGGEPTPVTRLEPDREFNHRSPQFLPDGRHFLYYVNGVPDVRGVHAGNIETGETRRLMDADAVAAYVEPGQLLFLRQGTLFAQPFDAERLNLSGDPHQIARDITVDDQNIAAVSASAAGIVAYRRGAPLVRRRFVWFDRAGTPVGTLGESDGGSALSPSMSQDGRRLLLYRTVDGNMDLWTVEMSSGVLSRLTHDAANELNPIWSPDGTRIVFTKSVNGVLELYERSTSSGDERVLLSTPQLKAATDWSRDGRFLLYRSLDERTSYDLWAMPLTGDRQPLSIANTTFQEREGQFSPDGRWIAYQSNQSGRFEIYVQRFPDARGKVQISSSGGAQVRWNPDGRELFYVALDARLMSVPIVAGPESIEAGTPVPLFATHIGGAVRAAQKQQYIVSLDGQRFLMNTVAEEARIPITLRLTGSTNR
jgi:Tol biopolymer transport system component/tRNA A-37 threonylcarbamoyl transferase component Bud32